MAHRGPDENSRVKLAPQQFAEGALGEIRRLRARLLESEAENDQWQKKLAETWAELEQTRAEATRLQGEASLLAEALHRAQAEIGRLRTSKAMKKAGKHD